MPKKNIALCIEKGCKQPKDEGWDQCKDHRPFDPIEDATRLTVAEAEKWGRLDAEIRNSLLGQKIKVLENKVAEFILNETLKTQKQHYQEQQQQLAQAYKEQKDKVEKDFVDKKCQQDMELQALRQETARLKIIYEELTKELAEKYKVDLAKMVIDPDTRIIRETE